MKKRKVNLKVIFLFVFSLILSIFFMKVPVTEQAKLVSVFFQISSVIFAILGIWIAILDPVSILEKVPTERESSRGKLAKALFPQLKITTAVFIVTLIINFSLPLLKYWNPISNSHILLRISFGFVLSFLFILQVWAIIGTLQPIFIIRSKERQDKTVVRYRKRDDDNLS